MTTAILPLQALSARTDDADTAVVRAMASGDAAALTELYARHGGGVLSYLLGRVIDRRMAEELLQDVMLAAWRGAPAFRGDARVRTWLLTIAHNRSINAMRRRQVVTVELAPRQVDPRGGTNGLPDHTTDRLDLRRAVDCLPEDQRTALDLVFFHELSIAEAARVLGVAEGTVKSRLHRARGTLRERLRQRAEPARAQDPS